MDLRLLREETRARHEATEALLPWMDARLTREHYGQMLQCFYRYVSAWESWATQHAPPQLASVADERRRAPLLLRDLRFLEMAVPLETEDQLSPFFKDLLDSGRGDSPEFEAAFLGAMYVMEGSTLGGQYIARQVEDVLGLAPGEGDAYFRGYGEQTSAMWNAFRQVLAVVPEEHSALLIRSANAAFEYVQEVIRGCPAASGPSKAAA